MAHIFISYSRRDAAYARKLADRLLERGFDVWFDEQIEYGQNWEQAIFRAIDACAAFVVIMTPDSAASEWVQRENAYAERRKKPIYPLLLAGEEFPRYILTQYVNVVGGALPSDEFYERLAEHIPRRPARGAEIALRDVEKLPPALEDTRPRRLEAAMPRQSARAQGTEVRIKVSLLDSAGLRGELPDVTEFGDEIRKADVRETGFPLTFPVDASGRPLAIKLCAQITSDHFEVRYVPNPCGDGAAEIDVPPDHDSRTVIFTLRPRDAAFAGRASVTVRLLREGRVIAENLVSTRVVEQVQEHGYALAAAPLNWALAGAGAVDAGMLVGSLPLPGAPTIPQRDQRRRGGPSSTSDPTVPIRPAPATPMQDVLPPPTPKRRSGFGPITGVVAVLFAALIGVTALLLQQGGSRPNNVVSTTGETQIAALATSTVDTSTGGDRALTATALAVLRPSPTSQPTIAIRVITGVIDGSGESDDDDDAVVIYEGSPRAGFTESGTLTDGTEVRVRAQASLRGQTWLQIVTSDGREVWIDSAAVLLTDAVLDDVPIWSAR